MEHTLLVEKWRPNNLEDYVGNENLKQTLTKYLSQNDIQNFIFYGPAGSGKTTLAKIIVKNLDCDYLYINASDENGIDTIRDKVKGFASSASFKSLKVIILDEADYITIQGQAALRNIIETFSKSTRFILTCNFIERIIDPLQSRCQVIKIIPPSKAEVAQHLHKILTQEKIEFNLDQIKTITNQFYPDIRKMLNTVQALTNAQNKLVDDSTLLINNSYHSEILKELQTKTPSWKNIRQIIANSNIKDFDELYKFLYNNISSYASGREGSIVMILNEHMYQANFKIDKEINIMSAFVKIIEILKPQII
jgi:replication factor C small subunit